MIEWRTEIIVSEGGEAWRVLNDDNDIEFMFAEGNDALTTVTMLNRAEDLHSPGYGYSKHEFREWRRQHAGDV